LVEIRRARSAAYTPKRQNCPATAKESPGILDFRRIWAAAMAEDGFGVAADIFQG
jgi:hypothetical protein